MAIVAVGILHKLPFVVDILLTVMGIIVIPVVRLLVWLLVLFLSLSLSLSLSLLLSFSLGEEEGQQQRPLSQHLQSLNHKQRLQRPSFLPKLNPNLIIQIRHLQNTDNQCLNKDIHNRAILNKEDILNKVILNKDIHNRQFKGEFLSICVFPDKNIILLLVSSLFFFILVREFV